MYPLPHSTRQIAAALRWFSLLCIVGLAGAAVYLGFNTDYLIEEARNNVLTDAVAGIGFWEIGLAGRAALAALGVIGLAIMGFTLWHMARLFAHFAAGESISPAIARQTRRIGLGFLMCGVYSLVSHTLTGLALSIDAPVGHRVLAVRFETNDAWFLLSGGMLMIIGLVMQQALALKVENEGFV